MSRLQLTQREFLFLEDAMAAEQLGVVQFQDLAQHCTDPELRALCLEVANLNLQHFGRLLRILNQSEGGQGSYHVAPNQASHTSWSHLGSGEALRGQIPGGSIPGSNYTH